MRAGARLVAALAVSLVSVARWLVAAGPARTRPGRRGWLAGIRASGGGRDARTPGGRARLAGPGCGRVGIAAMSWAGTRAASLGWDACWPRAAGATEMRLGRCGRWLAGIRSSWMAGDARTPGGPGFARRLSLRSSGDRSQVLDGLGQSSAGRRKHYSCLNKKY